MSIGPVELVIDQHRFQRGPPKRSWFSRPLNAVEARDIAVAATDGALGYTIEHSHSPEEHRQHYDWLEDTLTGLTPLQAAILVRLYEHGPASGRTLSNDMSGTFIWSPVQGVGRAIRSLFDRGIVTVDNYFPGGDCVWKLVGLNTST